MRAFFQRQHQISPSTSVTSAIWRCNAASVVCTGPPRQKPTVPSSACVWWSGHEAPCQHPVKPWHILTRYLSIEKPHQRSSQNHNCATFLKQIPFNNQTWLDVSPPFLETDDFHNGKPPWNVSQGFPGRRRSPGFDGRLRRRRDYALFGTAPAQPERIPALSGTMAKRGKSTISMWAFNG